MHADDVAAITSWTTGTGGPSRFTSGADRLLVFVAGMEHGADLTINSVTFGDQQMQQVVTTGAWSNNTYARVYIFYLKDAGISAAASNTFSVNWSSSPGQVLYAARMYQNVDQANPIRQSDTATTSSSTPNPISTSPMSVLNGDVVVSAAFCGNASSYSWNNSFTEGTDQSASSSQMSTAQRSVAFDGNVSASATFGSSVNRQVIVGAVLQNNTVPEPETYYVRPDGSDSNSGTGSDAGSAWRTINKALRDSPVIGGDTIYVKSGTYAERLYPNVDGTSSLPIQVFADTDGTIFGESGEVIVQAPTDQIVLDLNNDNYFTFRGFTFSGSNSATVVSLTSSAGLRLEQCEITSGGMGVEVLDNASSVDIVNCLIQRTGNDAIHIYNGNAEIWNSTLCNNAADGIELDAGVAIVRNCIIAENGFDGLDLNSGTLTHTYNLVFGNADLNFEGTTLSTGEIVQDPQFVGDDYRLSAGSPAINVGLNAGGSVDDDKDGTQRPLGGAWDLGCFEYALLGDWQFNEGLGFSAADSSGNGSDAVLEGATAWEAGRCGQTVKLNGSTDWIDLGQLNLGTKAYTVSIWFKTTRKAQQTLFATTAIDSAASHASKIQLDADGHVQFVHRSPAASSGGSLLSSDRTYRDGAWHQVVAVKSTSELRLYIDGEVVDSTADTTSVPSPVDIVVGRSGASLSQDYFFGSIDDVELYGAALSPNEVLNLMGLIACWRLDDSVGTTAIDSSLNANNASLVGGGTWTEGKVEGALEFDGLGDYAVTSAEFDPPSAGTVTCWIYVSEAPTSTGRVFGLSDAWEVRHVADDAGDNSANVLVFDLGVSGSNPDFHTTTTFTGGWHHFAATYDTSTNSFATYVDGVSETSGTLPYSMSVPTAGQLSLGTRTGSSDYWKGKLDDLRIYNRVLCADEIESIYSGAGPRGVRILKWVEIK